MENAERKGQACVHYMVCLHCTACFFILPTSVLNPELDPDPLNFRQPGSGSVSGDFATDPLIKVEKAKFSEHTNNTIIDATRGLS